MKTFLSQVKDAVAADSIGKNKAGNVVVRDSYFYTHGRTADSFAKSVADQLRAAGVAFDIVDHGDHYASFRGGATVAQGSHFWVIVSPRA